MSYILDALNKSEQERRNRQAPGIDSVHGGPAAKATYTYLWFSLLIIVLLLNAGFIYWWMQTAPTTARPAEPVPASSPEPIATVAMPNEAAGQLITPDQYYQQQAQQQTQQHIQQRPIDSEPQMPNVLRVSELPVSIQRAVPDLVFSSHIYADEPSFRMVNINGRLLREGDMLDDEIRLEEITEEGVTLQFRGYTFEVSVLRDWSFN